MHTLPKTPSRHRTRSEAKTPLTPSVISGMNGVSLASSPTKKRSKSKSTMSTGPFDVSNPFISATNMSRSRPGSPTKMPSAADLQRQAASGVIRKGGIESKLDVVKLDYVPPPKTELKRSKSTPVRLLSAAASLQSDLCSEPRWLRAPRSFHHYAGPRARCSIKFREDAHTASNGVPWTYFSPR